jgi:hypothetical protein
MSPADRAATVVDRWSAVYTRRLEAAVAEERRAELTSDLWEQRAHGQEVGAPALAVALSILRRAAAGVPADLRWRHGQLAGAGGRLHERGGLLMRGTLARNWWVALAVLAGIGEVLFGIALALQDRNAGAYAGGAVIATAGLVVLGGVAWRRRSRIVGDLLIAVGVLPLLPFWWMVAPTLLALVVLIAATLDAADARSLGRSARPVGAGGKAGLAILAAVVAAVVAAARSSCSVWPCSCL